MMKHFLVITVFLIFSAGPVIGVKAQDQPARDSLAADFSRLVKLLEETHPDPYTGFGGRYFFHKEAFRISNILGNEDTGIQGFTDLATGFLANIKDEHTYISGLSAGRASVAGFAPVIARVIPDGLIINGVASGNEHLLGSRVVAVEGMPIGDVLKKLESVTACENIYGAYQKLAGGIGNGQALSKLFPGLGDTVTLTLQLPEGNTEDVVFPLMPREELLKLQVQYPPRTEVVPSGDISYGYLGNSRDVMMLRIGNIEARENFRFMKDNGWSALEGQLGYYYRDVMRKAMPEDIDEAIENIPSFSETFLSMLKEMKSSDSETLVIDLRGNGGGWTPIVLPSLYMMFGDDYLTADMGVEFSRMVSELLLHKQNVTLEAFNKREGHDYRLGDFTMPDGEGDHISEIRELRREFISSSMTATPDELEKQQGKPVYRPANIYVLTDASTFSAAFHYAFYLWRMGAVVAGVPCRQAPNTFMEQTSFELPYTKLQGSISNSMQICFPGQDPRAKIFWPDMRPSYEDYLRYGFDLNTEVLWLIDKLN